MAASATLPAACGPSHGASRPGDDDPAARGVRLVVVRAGSERPRTKAAVAFAEVVSRAEDRRRGLGERTGLAPDHGMLFVYAQSAPRRFWMKDCRMGLDIAFIREDCRIARIATLSAGAGLPDAAVPEASTSEPIRWVLEMSPGWCAAHGVREHDLADVSAAVAGVEAD